MSSIRSPSGPPRSSQVWLKWCRNRCGYTVHAALAAPAGDHLVDPAGRQRPPVVYPQPQLRPVRQRVPGADPQVAVQAAGGVVADLDDPGLAALAANGDLPLLQVDVAASLVVGVVADPGQLGQADAARR